MYLQNHQVAVHVARRIWADEEPGDFKETMQITVARLCRCVRVRADIRLFGGRKFVSASHLRRGAKSRTSIVLSEMGGLTNS